MTVHSCETNSDQIFHLVFKFLQNTPEAAPVIIDAVTRSVLSKTSWRLGDRTRVEITPNNGIVVSSLDVMIGQRVATQKLMLWSAGKVIYGSIRVLFQVFFLLRLELSAASNSTYYGYPRAVDFKIHSSIHWKALEQYFLTVPLDFGSKHLWGVNAFSEFVSKNLSRLALKD
jgi:hypothetical protein